MCGFSSKPRYCSTISFHGAVLCPEMTMVTNYLPCPLKPPKGGHCSDHRAEPFLRYLHPCHPFIHLSIHLCHLVDVRCIHWFAVGIVNCNLFSPSTGFLQISKGSWNCQGPVQKSDPSSGCVHGCLCRYATGICTMGESWGFIGQVFVVVGNRDANLNTQPAILLWNLTA